MNIVRNIIISIALWPALLFSQTSFYVSSKGNEANPGTKTRPFASLKRALIEARKTQGCVTINLFGGTYYLNQPIVFISEDSRKENETLTKASAKKVQIPAVTTLDKVSNDEIIDFIGAKIKNLNTAGERSATGMDDARGVLVLEVTSGSGASNFLQTNDVIFSLNNKTTNNLRDLLEARMSVIGTNAEIIVFRNQKEVKKLINIGDKK